MTCSLASCRCSSFLLGHTHIFLGEMTWLALGRMSMSGDFVLEAGRLQESRVLSMSKSRQILGGLNMALLVSIVMQVL